MARARLQILLIGPAIIAGACRSETPYAAPESCRRLAREAFLAEKLEVDRRQLEPHWLVRRPDQLEWNVTGARLAHRSSKGVRFAATGPFSAQAELAIAAGVPYTVRARLVSRDASLSFLLFMVRSFQVGRSMQAGES